MAVEDVLKRHAAVNVVGSPGYPLPSGQYTRFDTSKPDDINTLRSQGINVSNPGLGNAVWVEHNFQTNSFDINFSDRSDNCVVIGAGFNLGGRIDFLCEKSTALIGGGNVQTLAILCDGSNSIFYLGPNCYIGDLTCWVQGERRVLAIGEDCMLGWKIGIRTGDFHGMFDLATGGILNPPEDTIIGPHVWLTNTIQIMKGLVIGAGTIVGAGSIVTKSLPASSLAAGCPTRVIRGGVGWSREANPSQEYILELASRAYMTTANETTVSTLPRLPLLHRLLSGFREKK